MHEIATESVVMAELVIAVIFLVAGTIVTRESFQRTQRDSSLKSAIGRLMMERIKNRWLRYFTIAACVAFGLFFELAIFVWAGTKFQPWVIKGTLALCFLVSGIKLVNRLTRAFIGQRDVCLFVGSFGIVAVSYVTAMWFFYPNIFLLDFAAGMALLWLLLATTFNYPILVAMSLGVIYYDVHSVFHTHKMLALAKIAHESPMMMTFSSFLIGLGDIAIPGLFVMLAFRAGSRYGNGIIYSTVLGYMIMFFVTIAMVRAYGPQPATLYLLPGVAVPYLLYAIVAHCKEALTSKFLKVKQVVTA